MYRKGRFSMKNRTDKKGFTHSHYLKKKTKPLDLFPKRSHKILVRFIFKQKKNNYIPLLVALT